AVGRCDRIGISRVGIVDEGRVIGDLELRFHRLRVGRRQPFGPHSLGPEQLEQGVERRQIPLPRTGQEARRPEIAGEAGLFLETPKEREALPGESDADARFVVLSHQGAAVARGTARPPPPPAPPPAPTPPPPPHPPPPPPPPP